MHTTYAKGEWNVQTLVGQYTVAADYGKVSLVTAEPANLQPGEARAIAEALIAAAEMAEAQDALRRSSDAHGARSLEAQAARSRLDSLRAGAGG